MFSELLAKETEKKIRSQLYILHIQIHHLLQSTSMTSLQYYVLHLISVKKQLKKHRGLPIS